MFVVIVDFISPCVCVLYFNRGVQYWMVLLLLGLLVYSFNADVKTFEIKL